MGAALHAGAPAPASYDAAHQRCGPGCAGLRTGGGRTSGAARISLARDLRDSLQYTGRSGCGTGSDLVRLLQRLRSTLAADLPALDGAGVFAAGCGCFLATGKSALENHLSALQRRTVVVHGHLRGYVHAGSVLALLHRIAAPRSH